MPIIKHLTANPHRSGGLARRISAAVAAVLMLAGTTPATALSLGAPEILSSLGEPLRIDLAIESDPSSGGLPTARLIHADGSEAWTLAGVPGALRLDILPLDDVHQRLQIHSSLPVWEPLLTLRIEVSQAAMRIVRELPILLDPPSATAPLIAGVAGTGEESAAIDTRLAPATAPPAAVATAAAAVSAATPAPPRETRAKAVEPAQLALPTPRFQLAAALSSYSLAWLQDNPQPVAQKLADEPAAVIDDDLGDTETVAADTESETPHVDRQAGIAPAAAQAAPASVHPRGLPMGSPWGVFLIMLAATVGLFAYARRMRRSMMAEVALAA